MSAVEIFLVDSNLLLHYLDPQEPLKRARATEWLDHLWLTGTGRLSWQVLHEFSWNSVRKMRMNPAQSREMLQNLAWDAMVLAAAHR